MSVENIHQKLFKSLFTSRFLDYILVMTYNLHNYKEEYTGENSPLYKSPTDTGTNVFLNMVCFWKDAMQTILETI